MQHNKKSTPSDSAAYHIPVMLQECLDGLDIMPDGVYVDVTFGGGGHSRGILSRLSKSGRLIAFDQDADAARNLPDDPRITFVHANFAEIKPFLRLHGVKEVDGILADLGVSSHQLDTAERGFSYRFEADLDMRMNIAEENTAAQILNGYSAARLQDVFSRYGEVRNSKTLAEAIVQQRGSRPIRTTSDLKAVMRPLIRGDEHRYLAQVFQALRMEVNKEMEVLEAFLCSCKDVLKPEGRIVVLTFHSLEDRAVKNYFKTGNCAGEPVRDFYGNIDRPFELMNKKAIEASAEEKRQNSRSQSAKLRIAKFVGHKID
jgi:16S rRNA (cytosine1402-N4)-methyltransferase